MEKYVGLNPAWFEPGPDGESPFVRKYNASPGTAGEAISAAFRALLAGEAAPVDADAKDAEIAELRAELERLKGELRHCNHMNRDLTAEVDRWKSRADAHEQNYNAMLRRVDEVAAERDALQASLRDEQAKRASIEAELAACRESRDYLRARIDAGVRAWEKWKQQCGSLWLWAFPGATTSQAWSDVCDALDADYVVYPIDQPVDERTAGSIADRGKAS